MPSWAWVVTGYEIVNTLFTDVSMPSWAWVVTTFKKVSRQNYDVSMPSRAWVVTYNGRNAGAAYSFQCPLGLELLLIMDGMPVQRIRFNALSGLSCYLWGGESMIDIDVSMPSRAWVVTFKLRSSPQHGLCFNALMGLSCYAYNTGKSANFHRFNALMGLSCYTTQAISR